MADSPAPPALSAICVHWQNEAELAELLASWPADPRFELVVVDNGATKDLPAMPPGARVLEPGRNLGFGGGVNAGLAATRGSLVLILNPDARPEAGALEALIDEFAASPATAGLAPRLRGADGALQYTWQLGRIPTLPALLLQALFLAGRSGPALEPAAGTAVEQPAACALALRRSALEAIGGFDAEFYPAWFEDVDLAVRLRQRGAVLRYWPDAVFRHGLGSSVPSLGYGRFLWIYDRNLARYVRKHHGTAAAASLRVLLPIGAILRLLALPLRKPRRARSRREAAGALLRVAMGAVTGWRWPG
ncbi:MAG: glycosyltransferase family 2 protein [Acidobacteriota bacterium]